MCIRLYLLKRVIFTTCSNYGTIDDKPVTCVNRFALTVTQGHNGSRRYSTETCKEKKVRESLIMAVYFNGKQFIWCTFFFPSFSFLDCHSFFYLFIATCGFPGLWYLFRWKTGSPHTQTHTLTSLKVDCGRKLFFFFFSLLVTYFIYLFCSFVLLHFKQIVLLAGEVLLKENRITPTLVEKKKEVFPRSKKVKLFR